MTLCKLKTYDALWTENLWRSVNWKLMTLCELKTYDALWTENLWRSVNWKGHEAAEEEEHLILSTQVRGTV